MTVGVVLRAPVPLRYNATLGLRMPLHEDAAASAASSPAVRATLAWSGFGTAEMLQRLGITSWSEAAGMAATVYTLFLIVDWLLKKARWWLYRRRVARLEAAHRGD